MKFKSNFKEFTYLNEVLHVPEYYDYVALDYEGNLDAFEKHPICAGDYWYPCSEDNTIPLFLGRFTDIDIDVRESLYEI